MGVVTDDKALESADSTCQCDIEKACLFTVDIIEFFDQAAFIMVVALLIQDFVPPLARDYLAPTDHWRIYAFVQEKLCIYIFTERAMGEGQKYGIELQALCLVDSHTIYAFAIHLARNIRLILCFVSQEVDLQEIVDMVERCHLTSEVLSEDLQQLFKVGLILGSLDNELLFDRSFLLLFLLQKLLLLCDEAVYRPLVVDDLTQNGEDRLEFEFEQVLIPVLCSCQAKKVFYLFCRSRSKVASVICAAVDRRIGRIQIVEQVCCGGREKICFDQAVEVSDCLRGVEGAFLLDIAGYTGFSTPFTDSIELEIRSGQDCDMLSNFFSSAIGIRIGRLAHDDHLRGCSN